MQRATDAACNVSGWFARGGTPRLQRMDGLDDALAAELRAGLDLVLADGMAAEPFVHAQQIAAIMTLLDQAFRADGLSCVLVGGAAIEVHAPGAHISHDLDLVVDTWGLPDARAQIARVFDQLGFATDGRHRALHGRRCSNERSTCCTAVPSRKSLPTTTEHYLAPYGTETP